MFCSWLSESAVRECNSSSSFKYNNNTKWCFIEQWNWTVERKKIVRQQQQQCKSPLFLYFQSYTALSWQHVCRQQPAHCTTISHSSDIRRCSNHIIFFFHHHHNYQQQVGVNLRRHTTAHHRHNLTLSLSLSLSRTAATTTAAIATCTSKQRQKQAVQHSTDYPTKALRGEKKHRRKRSRKNPI